jgi:hypothetical protein
MEDTLPMPKIRLHITINTVSRLNAVEEARSFSVEELSLREFLLNQILFLQELLEPFLMTCIIDELLGREFVAPIPRPRLPHRWRAGWRRGV